MKPFAKNVHIENLLKDSKTREEVLNGFINYIAKKPRFLSLFRSTGDGIVESNEIADPFKEAGVIYNEDTLEGVHSNCVQDIGPATKTRNFEKITQWLLSTASNGHAGQPRSPESELTPSAEFLTFTIRLCLDSQPWHETPEGDEECEMGKREFRREREMAADPVFDLSVANNSGRTLICYRVGIRLLQRKGRWAGNCQGGSQTLKVQSEFIVDCPQRWKQARGVLNDRSTPTEFVDPIMIKSGEGDRFTLTLKNFCDPDSATASEVQFYLETNYGKFDSKSIWLIE